MIRLPSSSRATFVSAAAAANTSSSPLPGGIETDLWRNWGIRMAGEQGISFEEWKAASLGGVPLRTISQPEDIGNLALFLACDDSRTITGQSINCDAGSIMIG